MTTQNAVLQRATLPNGVELHYQRDGAGPTVIFIHGAMGDWRSWAPQWASFTRDFDCVSYSRRYSHPNSNEMTVRTHNALVDAADLEGLMDALDIDRAILIGSSYGGFTALALAVQSPSRVAAVVAVEPPMMRYAMASDEGAPTARQFIDQVVRPSRALFEEGRDEEGVRVLTGGIVGRAPADVPTQVMNRRMQNVNAARSLSLSDDEFPWIDPSDLRNLPMPVLMMSGEDTAPVHAAIFKALTAAMPQARTRIIPQSGHSVSQQQPDAFNAHVRVFLKEAGIE